MTTPNEGLSPCNVTAVYSRLSRVHSIAQSMWGSMRSYDPDAPIDIGLRMLGYGRGAYGMTCASIASRYGISRSQAWRDKRDAEDLLFDRACRCHARRTCPCLARAGSSYPRNAYAEQVARLAMAQTQAPCERTPPAPGLGDLIRTGRIRRGWNQTQAAQACGITQPYLSQLENGLRCPAWTVAETLANQLLADDPKGRNLVVGYAVVGRGRDYSGPEPMTIDGREIRRVHDLDGRFPSAR